MADVTFLTKHLSYLSSDEVSAICAPLFTHFNANYFDFCRQYHDGSCLVLVSNREWYQHYFECEYTVSGSLVQDGIFFWSNYMQDAVNVDAATNFDIGHGLTIAKKHAEFIEFFDIAAPIKNTAFIQTCMNHMNLIQQFLLYFKSKAEKLIQQSYQNRFSIPETMLERPMTFANYQNFLEEIKGRRQLRKQDRDVTISYREYGCLYLLSKGKSLKEIASEFNVSSRTVETHIENAKIKTDSFS